MEENKYVKTEKYREVDSGDVLDFISSADEICKKGKILFFEEYLEAYKILEYQRRTEVIKECTSWLCESIDNHATEMRSSLEDVELDS